MEEAGEESKTTDTGTIIQEAEEFDLEETNT